MSAVTLGRLGRVLACASVVGMVACGPASTGSETSAGTGADRAPVCELLDVPREYMARSHLTFALLLTLEPGHDHGVGSMVGFLYPERQSAAGRFRPVLRFLTQRSTAATTPGRPPIPKASRAVTRNAKELDAWLAAGGCD